MKVYGDYSVSHVWSKTILIEGRQLALASQKILPWGAQDVPLYSFPQDQTSAFTFHGARHTTQCNSSQLVVFLHSPVICEFLYFLCSESNLYFPTAIAFPTPSAIISNSIRRCSAFFSKVAAYNNIATHVITIYTYALHITSSEALLSPLPNSYSNHLLFFQIMLVHSFIHSLSLSPSSLFSFYFLSPYLTFFPCFINFLL